MPRVSHQHEQAVRNRILDAAIKVFGELGYDSASIQDVVRESGLSVGAVYTYFKGKEDLFLTACACEAERETERLQLRLADLGILSDRLKAAVDWAVDMAIEDLTAKGAMVHAWARADTTPELRTLLQKQRDESLTFARRLLNDAVAAGELPAWVDVDSVAAAFISMTNGFVVLANSGTITQEEARHEAYAILELLIAAPVEEPESVARLRGHSEVAEAAPAS
jgi:AcrR family transcriptional regulator